MCYPSGVGGERQTRIFKRSLSVWREHLAQRSSTAVLRFIARRNALQNLWDLDLPVQIAFEYQCTFQFISTEPEGPNAIIICRFQAPGFFVEQAKYNTHIFFHPVYNFISLDI